MATPRTQLAEQLVALVPAEWAIESTWRELNNLTRTTVQVGAVSYSPLPEAPLGGRAIELTVWLIVPFLDADDAEQPLEDALELLLAAIDDLPWLVWTSAERTKYVSGYAAFKITAPTQA